MNKKNNRKGFTTVELVIVIAVIAILATVLIPTFSNLIGNANDSAALQEANSAYKNWLADIDNAKTYTKDTVLAIVVADGKEVYLFQNNELTESKVSEVPCHAKVIKTATNDKGYETAQLPTTGDDAVTATHTDADKDHACDKCDVNNVGKHDISEGACAYCGKN